MLSLLFDRKANPWLVSDQGVWSVLLSSSLITTTAPVLMIAVRLQSWCVYVYLYVSVSVSVSVCVYAHVRPDSSLNEQYFFGVSR